LQKSKGFDNIIANSMAVPKQGSTKSRQQKRRMHHFIKGVVCVVCSKCKQPCLPHRVCTNCGFYKGKEVINVLAKLEKKERKKKEQEINEAEKETAKEQKPPTLEQLSKKKF